MGQMPNTDHVDDFPMHPKGGPYGFIIKEASDIDLDTGEALSRQDRTPLARVILEPDSEMTRENEPRCNVMQWFTLTEKFLFLLKRFRVALGRPDGPLSWEDIVGMRVVAYIEHNPVKGKTYANVSNWEPYKEVQPATTGTPPKGSKNENDPPW